MLMILESRTEYVVDGVGVASRLKYGEARA